MYDRRSLLKNPIVSLSSDGTVTGIEVCDDLDSRAGVEFYSGILVPTFVNAHCHLEYSSYKGAIQQGGGFTEFAKRMGELRGKYSEHEKVMAARREDERMWLSGVGAVGDICNGTAALQVKNRSGIFYRNFLEVFGLGTTSLEHTRKVSEMAEKHNLLWSVTPHATYSLSDAVFAMAVEGLKNQPEGDEAPLSIHFMESPQETEFFEGGGQLAEWYKERGLKPDILKYGSPADRLIAQVPSSRDVMLIHNCFLTEEDYDKVMNHFTGQVTWVLCPRSNQYISNVEPPVELLRRKGARIAVGTDSLASNHSIDMAQELAMFRNVPLEELLHWATTVGGEALGAGDDCGRFVVGGKSGAAILTGIDWMNMSLTKEARTSRIV